MSGKLKIGKISGAQGLRGEVKLYHDSGDAEALGRLSRLYLCVKEEDDSGTPRAASPPTEFFIEELRFRGRTPILKLTGVEGRDGAEALRDADVYADEEESRPKEEGAWFVSDLIGLEVRLGGAAIGRIKSIIDNPAHDILEIERIENAEETADAMLPNRLLPFIDIFVPEVNIEAGYIIVTPPDGWGVF